MKSAILNACGSGLRKWLLFLLCLTAFNGISCGDHSAAVSERQTVTEQTEVSEVHETLTVPDTTAETTAVYVTDTGEKYHRASCRYLKMSKTEISLAEAKRLGYTPCKVCVPPK